MPTVLCLPTSFAKRCFRFAALSCLALVAGCAKNQPINNWAVPQNVSMTEALNISEKCAKQGRGTALYRRCLEAKGFKYAGKRSSAEVMRRMTANLKKGQSLSQTYHTSPPGMSPREAKEVARKCNKAALATERKTKMSAAQHDKAAEEVRTACLKRAGFSVHTRTIKKQ